MKPTLLVGAFAIGCAIEPTGDEGWGVGGCLSLVNTRECVTAGPERIVVWVRDGLPSARPSGAAATPEAFAGGTRWTFSVDKDTDLVIPATNAGPEVRVRVRTHGGPWLNALRAGAQCAPFEPGDDLDLRAFYASGLARCASTENPMDTIQQAIHLHAERQDSLRVGWDLAFRDHLAQDTPTAEEIPWAPSAHALEARYLWLERHGRTAAEIGNLGDAERLLDTAATIAAILERDDEGAWETEVRLQQISNLLNAGRSVEAVALANETVQQAQERAPNGQSCTLGMALTARAWVGYQAKEDPTPLLSDLTKAESFAALCRSPDDYRWHIQVNRAALFLQNGNREGADSILLAMPTDTAPDPDSLQWLRLVLAEWHLQHQRTEEALQILAPLLNTESIERPIWRAFGLAARAHIARDETEQALQLLENVEERIPAYAAHAPLIHGRGAVVDDLVENVLLMANLLEQAGRNEEAWEVLRRHRRAVLFDLQRSDLIAAVGSVDELPWSTVRQEATIIADTGAPLSSDTGMLRRPVDAGSPSLNQNTQQRIEQAIRTSGLRHDAPLRSPDPDELLVFLAEENGQLVVRSQYGQEHLRSFSVAFEDGVDEWGPSVLSLLDNDIARAAVITLLPTRQAREANLSRVLWRGEPLGLQRVLRTSLEIRNQSQTSHQGVRKSIVIADPRGDLVHAREEGEAVAAALSTLGPARLIARSDATLPTVASALNEGVDFLHLAGHASFSADGWDSAFRLSGTDYLYTWQVLTLQRAPRVVTMTACDSSRTQAGAAERLGLAQAFLIAGSDVVVAADAPVSDRLGSAFGIAWAESLANGSQPNDAYLAGLRAAHQQNPQSRWWSFQMFSP